MRRKLIRYPGGHWRIANDDIIASRYEAITDPANLPPPDEVSILVATKNARRRILSHSERISQCKTQTLNPDNK